MAHFARLDELNIVTSVEVVNNSDINDLPFPESEPVGVAFLNSVYGETINWKQKSYNRSFRKNYACIGFSYDEVRDAFIPVKCHDEATLNEDTCTWDCTNAVHTAEIN